MRKVFLTGVFLLIFGWGYASGAEKAPMMNAAGKVVEISESSLKMERTVKGSTEIMEFVLEKPLVAYGAGEQIKVSYRQKEMKNVLVRAQKTKKTVVRKQEKRVFDKVFESAAPASASPVK
jgi:hypothetical protein